MYFSTLIYIVEVQFVQNYLKSFIFVCIIKFKHE
jgi:hypothetical protein